MEDRGNPITDAANRLLPPGARFGVAMTGAVAAYLVLGAVSFGAKTACTTRWARSCGGIDRWAWGGLVASALVALVGAVRGRTVRSAWITLAGVGVVVTIASCVMLALR